MLRAPSPAPPYAPSPRCSEAKARSTNAQQGDGEFLEAACRFLLACTAAQVRLAPSKCERTGSRAWSQGAAWGLAHVGQAPWLQRNPHKERNPDAQSSSTAQVVNKSCLNCACIPSFLLVQSRRCAAR